MAHTFQTIPLGHSPIVMYVPWMNCGVCVHVGLYITAVNIYSCNLFSKWKDYSSVMQFLKC